MKKTLFLFAFLLICASCFAGVFDALIGNRYKGIINSNGVNYELYIVESDAVITKGYVIHAKITGKDGNVTWVSAMGNGSNSVKTIKLNKLNKWGVFENQNAEANHDGFDIGFLTKKLNKGSVSEVLKALHLTSEEIKLTSMKESMYEVQTEFGVMKLKMLKPIEK